MKNSFQIILLSIFGFFIILGLVIFASYKVNNSKTNNAEISIWGSVDQNIFNNLLSKIRQDLNIELNIKYTQKERSILDQSLIEAIASGKGPDVVLLPSDLIIRYSDKISLISPQILSERIFSDTFVQESNLYITSSGITALPFFVDPLVMYWNKDIFSGAGIATPPTKWSEIPLLASKFSKSDTNANILQSAVAFGGFNNINNAKEIISALIMQTGNKIVQSDGTKLNSSLISNSGNLEAGVLSPVEQALNFYTDYSNPKKSVYSWNSALVSDKQLFLSGDLALYFGKASELPDLRAKNPNLNFDVAMLPQVVDTKTKTTYGDIQGFAILNSSKNIAQAYTTISTLTGPDVSSVFLRFTSYSPARRDTISAGTADLSQTIFYNSALISKGWLDPDSVKTSQIFQNMINDITTGRSKTLDSLKKASQELDYLL
ncbi:MAG: extracellular solute-binding protein [Candidatus Paceibacterota bacterium]|jgi:ABC-type glycerol-3-phosphate transport system substrate-binding protein